MGNGQSGGIHIVGNVGGDVVYGDKVTHISMAAIDDALRPVQAAVDAAPGANHAEAQAKLAALKGEVAKGKGASDGLVAKLLEGLVALVPAGVSATVAAFGTPLLAAVSGPATNYVLSKLKGE